MGFDAMCGRFFWERTLKEVPHCVVFVFDGSQDPFLDGESLLFFQTIYKDCSNHGIINIILKTLCLIVCIDRVRASGSGYSPRPGV